MIKEVYVTDFAVIPQAFSERALLGRPTWTGLGPGGIRACSTKQRNGQRGLCPLIFYRLRVWPKYAHGRRSHVPPSASNATPARWQDARSP